MIKTSHVRLFPINLPSVFFFRDLVQESEYIIMDMLKCSCFVTHRGTLFVWQNLVCVCFFSKQILTQKIWLCKQKILYVLNICAWAFKFAHIMLCSNLVFRTLNVEISQPFFMVHVESYVTLLIHCRLIAVLYYSCGLTKYAIICRKPQNGLINSTVTE